MGDHREPPASRTGVFVASGLAFVVGLILVLLYVDALMRWWV